MHGLVFLIQKISPAQPGTLHTLYLYTSTMHQHQGVAHTWLSELLTYLGLGFLTIPP